jgi:hypothetical protein
LARLGRQPKVLLADAKVGPGHATDELVRSAGGLEDMPLIVLTQGDPSSPNSAAYCVDGSTFNGDLRTVHVAAAKCWCPTVDTVVPWKLQTPLISAVREIVTTVLVELH